MKTLNEHSAIRALYHSIEYIKECDRYYPEHDRIWALETEEVEEGIKILKEQLAKRKANDA